MSMRGAGQRSVTIHAQQQTGCSGEIDLLAGGGENVAAARGIADCESLDRSAKAGSVHCNCSQRIRLRWTRSIAVVHREQRCAQRNISAVGKLNVSET